MQVFCGSHNHSKTYKSFVQRQTSRFILNKHNIRVSPRYMLSLLNFPPLFNSSETARLIYLHSFYANQLRIRDDECIILDPTLCSRHKHTCILTVIFGRTPQFTYLLFFRAINDFNNLQPEEITTTASYLNSPG